MTRALALLVLLGVTGAARAQTASLTDPTRPPIIEPERSGDAAPIPPGPQLQSVLISPSRRVAVINGSAVSVGAKLGDATVTAISEDAVILRYADHKETLYLLPGVERRARGDRKAALREEGDPR